MHNKSRHGRALAARNKRKVMHGGEWWLRTRVHYVCVVCCCVMSFFVNVNFFLCVDHVNYNGAALVRAVECVSPTRPTDDLLHRLGAPRNTLFNDGVLSIQIPRSGGKAGQRASSEPKNADVLPADAAHTATTTQSEWPTRTSQQGTSRGQTRHSRPRFR